MGLLDDIKAQGASARITEEALYAEVLREIEQGIRRDGLWAKALAQSKMKDDEARARYIELRVQSLRDEISLIEKSASDIARSNEIARAARQDRFTSSQSKVDRTRPIDPERDRPPETVKDWLYVLLGGVFIISVGAMLINAFHWLTGR